MAPQMADLPADDPLARLREQLHATREVAERLAREAAGARQAEREHGAAPPGWDGPRDRDARAEEIQALVHLLDSLRALVPAELQQQLSEVIRQVLLLVRALIDWWVDRLEPHHGAEVEVEDIPIS
jgi:hypothetical protein